MYKIREDLLEEFKKPLGKVILDDQLLNEIGETKIIVSVGDMCTLSLKKFGITTKISVVDFKIERKNREDLREKFSLNGNIKVNNPQGFITKELWCAIEDAYNKDGKTIIEVNGEEDLATLPAIIMAPDNSILVYGLPGKGMVIVHTNEKIKEIVRRALKKMEV